MRYRFPKMPDGKPDAIWFGGDYNPEQWPEETVEEDIRLMRRAGINLVTLGVFAWALIEPEDGKFQFAWLDKIADRLYENGIFVDMATATATPPRWLTCKHPEILPRDRYGNTIWPGGRQHWRPTSSVFRKYALRLTEKMAEHYKDHPAVVAWHVSNELGCHNIFDYSEDAAAGFREWLKKKYGSLEDLNRAWNGPFWSQMVTDWSQIIPPRACSGGVNPTTLLDFKRFSSDALLEYYEAEAAVLHEKTPHIPVTTNLMVLENQTNPVDCFRWGLHMDFVSNDHYYLPDRRHLDEMTMSAAIVEGISKGNPWMLMENSTSSVNWRPVNLRKKPGEILRDALVHVANGADGICFFQWRQSAAGAEKFHSAMLPHAGENSRIYREVCQLGETLKELQTVKGTKVRQAPLAMLFDYDSWWAYENGLLTREFDYRGEFFHWYRAALDAGITADVVGKNADWEKYEAVMFPVTLLVDKDTGKRAERYVENGGKLIVTYGSGISDSQDHVYTGGYPGAFRNVLGIKVQEFVAVAENHEIRLDNGWTGTLWADDVMEITEDCGILACITDGDGDTALEGRPVVTKRNYGKGQAFYIGIKLRREDGAEFFAKYIKEEESFIWKEDRIPLCVERVGEKRRYQFIFNRSPQEKIIVPKKGRLLYLSNGMEREKEVLLQPAGVAVLSLGF
ncbi:MAG: beta-galactosidase [Clostridiales bacterium]|nr:beta-galactosidase [Clostridiales bacterium]